MAGKRSNGEGTIKQRSDGLWEARISLGNLKRKSLYGKTRQEVARKLAAATRDRDKGLPILTAERQTVATFLQTWLETKRTTQSYRTWQRYDELARLQAIPDIGEIALAKLTPQRVQQLYAHKLESGLSPTTVRHLHAMPHTALAHAARLSLVPRNVCDLVEAPRFASHEIITVRVALG